MTNACAAAAITAFARAGGVHPPPVPPFQPVLPYWPAVDVLAAAGLRVSFWTRQFNSSAT